MAFTPNITTISRSGAQTAGFLNGERVFTVKRIYADGSAFAVFEGYANLTRHNPTLSRGEAEHLMAQMLDERAASTAA